MFVTFNFSCTYLNTSMNNNSVKYLQGTNFLQITFAEDIQIKNLGREICEY